MVDRDVALDTSLLLNRIAERFAALQNQDPNALESGGSADITNIFYSIVPTVYVVASDARPWVIEAAEEAIANGVGGWYICDGIDDHEEITSAFDDLGTVGQVVLSEGTFNVDADSISVPSQIHLMGMGESTVIDCQETTGVIVVLQARARISNLELLLFPSQSNTLVGISAEAETRIRDIVFENLDICIRQDGNDVSISGCFGDTATTFFVNAAGYEHANIVGNYEVPDIDLGTGFYAVVVGNGMTGEIVSSGGAAHTIGLNQFDGNSAAGMIHLTNTTDCSIVGNVGSGLTTGIRLTGGGDHDVVGNIVGGEGLHGEHAVHLNNSSDNHIHGNTLRNFSDNTANTYDGVFLEGNSDRNHIHGNKLRPGSTTGPRYGINISAATCNDNRVGDNDYGVLTDYDTHPINDAGTGTRFPTAARAALSVPGALSNGAGAARWPFAEGSIILDAHPTVGTAPSGGPVTLDLNKAATSMYTTAANPTIADGTNVGSKAPADPTLFVEDDYMTLDIDAANGAADLTVVVRYLVG